MPSIPGVENSGGPLGQGVSQAVGMALGLRMRGSDRQVYCICSDGEHEEGQTWESIMLASKERLGNLIFIVDWNHIQIDGRTAMVGGIDDAFAQRYRSFGWKVFVIDGHNLSLIKQTLDEARSYRQAPVVVLANTVPGKGIDFMEHDYEWHGKAPDQQQLFTALVQLDEEERRIHKRYG